MDGYGYLEWSSSLSVSTDLQFSFVDIHPMQLYMQACMPIFLFNYVM